MRNKIALVVSDTKGGKVRSTNQSDRQSITPLAAPEYQQTARMFVGKCRQGKGRSILKSLTIRDTAPRSPHTRTVELLRMGGRIAYNHVGQLSTVLRGWRCHHIPADLIVASPQQRPLSGRFFYRVSKLRVQDFFFTV